MCLERHGCSSPKRLFIISSDVEGVVPSVLVYVYVSLSPRPGPFYLDDIL
jgi:hypothetical protein